MLSRLCGKSASQKQRRRARAVAQGRGPLCCCPGGSRSAETGWRVVFVGGNCQTELPTGGARRGGSPCSSGRAHWRRCRRPVLRGAREERRRRFWGGLRADEFCHQNRGSSFRRESLLFEGERGPEDCYAQRNRSCIASRVAPCRRLEDGAPPTSLGATPPPGAAGREAHLLAMRLAVVRRGHDNARQQRRKRVRLVRWPCRPWPRELHGRLDFAGRLHSFVDGRLRPRCDSPGASDCQPSRHLALCLRAPDSFFVCRTRGSERRGASLKGAASWRRTVSFSQMQSPQ